jgi:hypothetical protein
MSSGLSPSSRQTTDDSTAATSTRGDRRRNSRSPLRSSKPSAPPGGAFSSISGDNNGNNNNDPVASTTASSPPPPPPPAPDNPPNPPPPNTGNPPPRKDPPLHHHRRLSNTLGAFSGQEVNPSFKVSRVCFHDGKLETVNLDTSELLKTASIYARDLFFTLNLTSRQEQKQRGIVLRRSVSAIQPRKNLIVLSFGQVRAVVTLHDVLLLDAHNPAGAFDRFLLACWLVVSFFFGFRSLSVVSLQLTT